MSGFAVWGKFLKAIKQQVVFLKGNFIVRITDLRCGVDAYEYIEYMVHKMNFLEGEMGPHFLYA